MAFGVTVLYGKGFKGVNGVWEFLASNRISYRHRHQPYKVSLQ